MNIEDVCNQVLQVTQQEGGRISAVRYQQLVGNDPQTFRQVKMQLLALELIERRDDNKIFLTHKGLNVRNISQASKKEKNWGKIGAIATFISIVVAILIAIIAYII